LQYAILFVVGVFASLAAAFIAHRAARREGEAGWLYFSAITFRMLALLVGCTAVYVIASPGAGALIGAYALGIAAASLTHLLVALVKLRE